MAVELESVVQLYDEGVNYGKIGVSKAINNYTITELLDYLYAGVVTPQFKNYQQPITGVYKDNCTAPMKIGVAGTTVSAIQGEGTDGDNLYCRIIWCYTSTYGVNLMMTPTLSISDTGVYIITNMDAEKIVVKVNRSRAYEWDSDWQDRQAADFTNEGKAMDFTVSGFYQDNGAENYNPETLSDTHRHTQDNIAPFMIVPAGDSYILVNAVSIRQIGGGYGPVVNQPPATQYNYLTDIAGNTFSWCPVCTPFSPTSKSWYAYGLSFYGINTEGDNYSLYFWFDEGNRNYFWRYVPNTLNALLNYIIRCGTFIYVDKLYKAVISNGVITGFSDNPDAESELDNYNYGSGNKHDVPPSPPGPAPSGGDEDNDDPVNSTGAPFSAGLCHYYALTAGSVLLEHISEALGTWDIENTHKDLYKNLVSCKLIKPPSAIPTTGSEPLTIYGVKPQYSGADITLPVVSGNPEATFGPYSVPRKFGDFRDYAPYTRASIYLPYCGWCDLPSHVVGKQVRVKYFTDIIAATCKAIVFCGENIIAEAAGVIGLDIPFVADNVGAKMQAVTAGMIAALGGGIQLGAGIGTMVSTKSGSGAKAALSGASQYLSGYSQMAMAFNENTTEISGKNGDGCCLAGATNIIIKIVRPKKGAYTTAPYTPPGYGHNIGFVSQKQVKVSSVSGLLIADNVDTSGISGATEAERAEIKRVLESGLIVNAAP